MYSVPTDLLTALSTGLYTDIQNCLLIGFPAIHLMTSDSIRLRHSTYHQNPLPKYRLLATGVLSFIVGYSNDYANDYLVHILLEPKN